MALENLIITFSLSSFIDEIYFINRMVSVEKNEQEIHVRSLKVSKGLCIQEESYYCNLKVTEADREFTTRKHFIETQV